MSGNRTFTMIKPEAVEKGLNGAILKKIQDAGFDIIALKMHQLTQKQAEKFYADYLGEKGSINSIALGNIFFEGSLWQKKLNSNPRKTKKYINNFVPNKKFGKIEDINEICNFLINQKNNYTTGSTFIIDGGQTRKF